MYPVGTTHLHPASRFSTQLKATVCHNVTTSQCLNVLINVDPHVHMFAHKQDFFPDEPGNLLFKFRNNQFARTILIGHILVLFTSDDFDFPFNGGFGKGGFPFCQHPILTPQWGY